MNNPFLYRWLIFFVIANIYFFVWLHRVSVTVIAPDLISAFAADATALGIMSSSYFYLYAAVQPPVGFLADTLGPRRVITLFTLVACAGALIFGSASNLAIATVGRALIGAGVGGVFVPALKTFSKWYRPNEFTSMTGILLAVGGLGGLSGSLPLTYLVIHLGWRFSFVAIGGISFMWAIVCWCIVREKPEDKGWRPIAAEEDAWPVLIDDPPKAQLSQRLSMVLTKPSFWLVTLSLFFSGGALMTFQGLWAIPYLMDVHGYSRVQAGSLLMVIPLGFMLGAPAFGFLTDRWEIGRKKILLYALGLALGCWTIILLAGGAPPFFLLLPLFLILGACGGGSTAIHMTIMKELFPAWLTGTATGLLNTAAFLSAAVIQPLTGVLMDVVGQKGSAYPLEAYNLVFLTSWVCAGIAVVVLSVCPLPQKNCGKTGPPDTNEHRE